MIISVDAPTRADVDLLARVYARLCRRVARDPALIVHAPPSEALDRLVAAHAQVHVGGFADPGLRAGCLAGCDLALVLPGHDGGWAGCAEAMACGRAVVGAGQGGAELVGAAGCGRAVARADVEGLVAAVLDLHQTGRSDELGRIGRLFIERHDRDSCAARELACFEEVLERVRAGRRVAAGIHERNQPVALG
jgi:glycosyltransferase involved in cell wall biosynthesis